MGVKRFFENLRLKTFHSKTNYKRTGFGNREFKSIGVLYDFSDTKNNKTVNQFVAYLKSKHYEVQLLAFCNKQVPQSIGYGIPYQKKDAAFLRFPKSRNIRKFSKTEFDLLINFYLTDNRHLQLISAINPSGLRVAPYQDDQTTADFFLVNNKTNSLAHIQEQLINYLKL